VGTLPRPGAPVEDIVVLARQDAEVRSPLRQLSAHGLTVFDWATDERTPVRQTNRALRRCLVRYPGAFAAVAPMLWHTYDPLARERLARGTRLLGRGRAVITDRLHGHILSVLLGIPHVLLDNSYAKNRAFYETWTRNSTLTAWAETPEQALELARGMLAAAL
jgi:exopolysaccharide biosynthesis predicted pyruvyltransferase EpsI